MRISDWSSDVCSSDLPQRSLLEERPAVTNLSLPLFQGDNRRIGRQQTTHLVEGHLAHSGHRLASAVGPPPLHRATQIAGSIEPIWHAWILARADDPKHTTFSDMNLKTVEAAHIIVPIRGFITLVDQDHRRITTFGRHLNLATVP